MLKLPKYHDRKIPLFVVGYALAFANIGLIGAHVYQNGIQFPQSSIASFLPESTESNNNSGSQSDTSQNGQSNGLRVTSADSSDRPLFMGSSDTSTSPSIATSPSPNIPTQSTAPLGEPGRGSGMPAPSIPATPSPSPTQPAPSDPAPLPEEPPILEDTLPEIPTDDGPDNDQPGLLEDVGQAADTVLSPVINSPLN